jgi:hypothetical protein
MPESPEFTHGIAIATHRNGTHKNPLLEAALSYAKRSWSVIPLHDPAGGQCSCRMGKQCPTPGKHPRVSEWPRQATTDPEVLTRWWQLWPAANVGIATGARSGLVVVDVDPRNGGQRAIEALQSQYQDLPDTPLCFTGGGGWHLYFTYPDGVTHIQSYADQGALLPGLEIKADGGHQVVAPPSVHGSGRAYEWELSSHLDDVPLASLPLWLLQLTTERARQQGTTDQQDDRDPILEGRRNGTLFLLGCSMRARGLGENAIRAALREENAERCSPPLAETEVKKIAQSCARYKPGTIPPQAIDPEHSPEGPAQNGTLFAQKGGAFCASESSNKSTSLTLNALNALNAQSKFPTLPGPALHGLPGDFVKTTLPHTESSEAALLIQFLVAFGIAVGNRPYFPVEADVHHVNLFAVLVGDSSKGRKGTSAGHVRRLFRMAAEDFTTNGIGKGLSSGEGLIWAVRDPIIRRVRDKKGDKTQYVEVIEDPGVADKRLMVLESEFSRPLKVMYREGNTLSDTLRDAWDGGVLRSMTKNSPAKATGAHIGVIGHITREELLRHLNDTESANGFGNRFLWICTKRGKLLPEGGSLSDDELKPLAKALKSALTVAQAVSRMQRDAEARALWHEHYAVLSREMPGLLGAICARAEAQVLRLSCLYALLDQTGTVGRPHLEAAMALWTYAEDSARYIFGNTLGDPVAEDILRLLRTAPQGLTRADLYNAFARHRSSQVIGAALLRLQQQQLVHPISKPTDGRWAELWLATTLATVG